MKNPPFSVSNVTISPILWDSVLIASSLLKLVCQQLFKINPSNLDLSLLPRIQLTPRLVHLYQAKIDQPSQQINDITDIAVIASLLLDPNLLLTRMVSLLSKPGDKVGF